MAADPRSTRLELTADERDMLSGARGPAYALAMTVVNKMAEVAGAERLIEISGAHIDSCLYHGTVGLDFAERLAGDGATVAVPTTLNVSALDLLHPELIRHDQTTQDRARRLMDAYVAMGGRPTWTCAPYQLPERPALGEHVAWAESNAIVFANSVLGARTGRYGDFIDICAAITGRVPLAGLHLDDARRARIVFRLADDVRAAVERADPRDELYGLVGHIVGRRAGSQVPAVEGLPRDTTEDQLKELGAAAASSGAVALCHVVGVTPEAPTLADACGGAQPVAEVLIDAGALNEAWDELSTWRGTAALGAVSIGTPHASRAELERLVELLAGRRVHDGLAMYVSTGRDTLGALDGVVVERLADARITVVVDTCTYITPILGSLGGRAVMTDSAKWAWYAPGNMGIEVVYGAMADCVESAVAGRIIRERPSYLDG